MNRQKKELAQRTCKTETISALALQYFQTLRPQKTLVQAAQ